MVKSKKGSKIQLPAVSPELVFLAICAIVLAVIIIKTRSSTAAAAPGQLQGGPDLIGGRRYVNKEEVEIEWNSDGLPVKITTHRDARQI